MVELVRPSVEYRDSYIAALREFHAEGRHGEMDAEAISRDFPGFVQKLLDQIDPAKVPPGRVPDTVLWLVDGDAYIGRISIRHELNDYLRVIGGHIGYEIRPAMRRRGHGNEILRLALPHARALGLTRVLVTCDEDNIGSKKIIEGNGGVFENAVEQPDSAVRTLRYWIALPV